MVGQAIKILFVLVENNSTVIIHVCEQKKIVLVKNVQVVKNYWLYKNNPQYILDFDL